MKPAFKKYDLIFLNYSEFRQIPGDFQMDDLFELLNFFKKNGSIIFINFYNETKELTESKKDYNNEEDKNNDENKLYNLSEILFFDTKQAQKTFQQNYEYTSQNNSIENSENKEIIDNTKIIDYFIKKISDKKTNPNKTGLFLDKLDIFSVASLIKNKPYKKQYEFDLYPKFEDFVDQYNEKKKNENLKKSKNENLKKSKNDYIYAINNNNDENTINSEKNNEIMIKEYEELIEAYQNIIEENKMDFCSLLISLFVHDSAYFTSKFYSLKLINETVKTSIKLIKEKIKLIKYLKDNEGKDPIESEHEQNDGNDYDENDLQNNFVNQYYNEDEHQNDENENNFLNNIEYANEEEIDKDSCKNIIYLLDITYSMNRYKKIIYSLETLNKKLISNCEDLKIGYVLYKDYIDDINNNLQLGQDHIKVIPPSSESINIQDNENFIFDGGDDYAEDWANPLNEISNLALNKDTNLVIHICDSGAHGNRFSNYCNKKEQEGLLIKALNNCSKKSIKIIGIMIDNYAKQSFLECQKIYLKNEGYYNIIDLTELSGNNYNENNFINTIIDSIENALNNKITEIKQNIGEENNSLKEIKEEDFTFHELEVKMRKLSQIETYKDKHFCFLPRIENTDEIESIQGIKQGAIGDCYLMFYLKK